MPDSIGLLFDENIGRVVMNHLRSRNYDVISVIDELRGQSDIKILQYASKHGRILVTLDKDFADLVYKLSIPHAGIILLRLRDESPPHIIEILTKLLVHIGDFPKNKFMVVSESKIRIRK